jgi:hypothetical protein
LKKCKTKLLKGSEHLPCLETVKVQSFRPFEEEIVRPVAEESMREESVGEECMMPVEEETVKPVEEESVREEIVRPVAEET